MCKIFFSVIIEKGPCLSGPMWFKPMFWKGQLCVYVHMHICRDRGRDRLRDLQGTGSQDQGGWQVKICRVGQPTGESERADATVPGQELCCR